VSIAVFFGMTAFAAGSTPQGELLEYEVKSVDARGWIVTAQEVATGNVVKFRLPPAVFKGQTFDADLASLKQGQRFSVRGPRNARLNNLIMKSPPGEGKGQRLRRSRRAALRISPGQPLTWEILHVDARKWIVTARNRQTRKVIKFQAHPEAFAGFRFRANLRNIGQGKGFSIVTPNNVPMPNVCTLLELPK
jgi:hypothetical protein